MTRKVIPLLYVLIVMVLLPDLAQSGQFRILTNELPPIKTVKDGLPDGMAGHVLSEILSRTGVEVEAGDAQVMALSEAYEAVASNPNSVLMGLQRTPERESSFKWVGPVYTTSLTLIARKKDKLHIDRGIDATGLRVATVKESGAERLALMQGVPEASLVRKLKVEEAVGAFVRGETDLLAFPLSPALYTMLQLGRNPSEYEAVFDLKTVDIWIAFNKQVDDDLIRRLQKELDGLKKTGPDGLREYDSIIRNHFLFPF